VRSYQRSMQGLTLILLATQIVLTVRLPRPIGYAMAVAGLTYIVQGVVVGAEGFSSNGTIPGLLAFVLDIAWMVTMVLSPGKSHGGCGRLPVFPPWLPSHSHGRSARPDPARSNNDPAAAHVSGRALNADQRPSLALGMGCGGRTSCVLPAPAGRNCQPS
jgi:hypothetical protein